MLHRKNIRLALIFVGLAIIMCAHAAFGQATTTDTPFTDQPAPTTGCNGDTVLMTGTLHTVSSFSINPNGFIHSTFNSTLNATGIGSPSGAKYVISDTAHMEVNSKTMAQEQFMGTKMKMIAQGPYPNLTQRSTVHLVVDANGNVRVDTSKFQVSCN
jgi:hypothetical protein